MGQLLVRDLSDAAVEALKRRAARNGRSTEAEHRQIIEALAEEDHAEFWREADKLRAESVGWNLGDSTDLIREDRDAR